VRVTLLFALLVLSSACRAAEDRASATAVPSSSTRPAGRSNATTAPTHLAVTGTTLRTNDGKPFEWRGISAFRLLEMVAHGREYEAVAFLDWASTQRLTVVRVFVMAHHLFQLTPDDGVRALPRLLELAAGRKLHVEVVALADTAAIRIDLDQHVKAVGAVAAGHANALVEVANEPWHQTQDRRLHDPGYVQRLSATIPSGVPVALGSAERDPGYAAGSYVTWHSPRGSGQDGWEHVLEFGDAPRLLEAWRKPVISDEPIGAAATIIHGRRDNAPARFGAAAVMTRLAGLGATFHYEGGLQAVIPSGRELECLTAWRTGLALLDELPGGGSFVGSSVITKVGTVQGVRAAFARLIGNEIWIAGVDPAENASVAWRGGWKPHGTRRGPGIVLFRGRR